MPFAGPTVIPTGQSAVDRRTFLDMKNQLALPFNPGDATTLAIAGNAINNAIRKYNRKLWPWEILQTTVTVSSDTNTEALPQPFKKALSAHVQISSSQERRLGYIPWESFKEYSQTTSTGSPTVYTLNNVFENGEIRVFPTTISDVDIEVNYYRRTPILRADDAPLEGPPEFEQAILDEAWYEMVRMRPGMSSSILADARNKAAIAEAELVQLAATRGDNIGIP